MSGPGLFCEHKKLRTTCPACKPPPPPTPPRAPPAARSATPRPSASKSGDEDDAEKKAGPRAMIPKRRTKNRVHAEDEARAEAWWVKKD